jgi:hypothetical protein
MPSVDVIRNITIKGKADGVDDATAALNRLTASIAAANDNLAKSNAAGSSGSDGFTVAGLSAANAANHLRQAAEAAYAFSPAFRGVVQEMAVPALNGANIALAAIAAGIVTATNYAGTGVIALAGAAEKASPSLMAYTAGIRSTGIAMEAFSPSVGGAATSILSFLSPALRLLGWFGLAVEGIKLVGEAWDLGGQKLAEYVALSEKAAASGLTTDFFQRISKAATDAKLPVDSLLASLAKINESTLGKLGGSAAQLATDPLQTAGNFQGNTGVMQLQTANSTQEKLVAIVSLYDQAVAKGERLAALDALRAVAGDEIANKAALDNGYMDKMLASALAISATTLISPADTANAVELQNRLDAAEKILSERWHPIQTILTDLGVKMREVWVGIVEQISFAVDGLVKALEYIIKIDSLEFGKGFNGLMNGIGNGITNLTTTPQSRAASEAYYGISSNPTDIASQAMDNQRASAQGQAQMADARQRLAAGLNRNFDTSKPTTSDPNKPDPASTSAYDTATAVVQKYIETTKAASLAVSDAAGEQEKFKVIAQLTAAGIKDGLTPEAAKLKAGMSDLAVQAGAAADALAKAKEVSAIDFGRKTSFLSADDVAIATQLKGIYGNDIPAALNSTYAAGIRVNTAFKTLSTAIETNLTQGLTDIVSGAKSAGQAFSDMGKAIVTAIEQMIVKILIVQPLMQALQNSIGGGGILSFLTGGIGGSGAAAQAASASTLTNNTGGAFFGPGFHSGGIVGSGEASFNRYIHPSYFDDAPRFHSGGIAGDEVPIIAKKGEGVFTQGQMAAMGGGGAVNVSFAPVYNVKGNSEDINALRQQMVQDQANFAARVVATVKKAKTNRVL